MEDEKVKKNEMDSTKEEEIGLRGRSTLQNKPERGKQEIGMVRSWLKNTRWVLFLHMLMGSSVLECTPMMMMVRETRI